MAFTHFPEETVKFYEDIALNNNKEWFEKNRKIYDDFVAAPAKDFVETLGKRLKEIVPGLNCVPKIDGSIFRIYKDARLHRGRSPFKTHLGIFFWEGSSRLDSPGFYFNLEPPFYALGAGMPKFSPEILTEYRESLGVSKYAKELFAVRDTAKKRGWKFRGEKRKTPPKGAPAAKGAEEFQLYKNLYLNDETPINEDFYKDSFIEEIFETFAAMAPYHKWLAGICRRAGAKKARALKTM